MYLSQVLAWTHFITAVIALIFGSLILISRKGTAQHRRLGQAYFISMSVMLASAFSIYRLDGSFGIFHYAATISSMTLIAGIFPLYWMLPNEGRRQIHMRFMYWSIIGLYMALAAEITTRIPTIPFMPAVYLSSGLVFLVGLSMYRHIRT